ncbi:MAG TPA: SRPBCC family protein [Chloroflexota bacterium]|nr:SRPBCC family protein [Chloroflexota bacterium]
MSPRSASDNAMPAPLVDVRRGLVSRRIFSDPALYERELEQVFGRCWLFLGPEAALPAPGDFVTSFMGEDPVIVCRDPAGRVRAFLNSCRHRGNAVCQLERGHALAFTCGYHGWTYNTEGQLTGVPFHAEAYYDDLDRAELGLLEVPRLEVFGGLIFGCWDPAAPPLAAYLGGMGWYLDRLVVAQELGGLDVAATTRYRTRGNWKFLAENAAGDHYHTPTAHGAANRLGIRGATSGFEYAQADWGPFEVALEHGHGLGGLVTGRETYERDLARARTMGPEVVEYVTTRYARLQERLADTPSKPYVISHGNVFPNFSFVGGQTALRGWVFYLIHPKGPTDSEVWQWLMLPRAAPPAVRAAALTQFRREGHFAAGMFEQDDAEIFERTTESTRSPRARELPFHYGMGLRQEGRWPGQEGWDIAGLPGLVGPRFSEHNQRGFYAYWAALVQAGEP